MNAAELTKDRLPEIRNIPVYAADGEQLGHVGDAYYDEESGRLRCVGVAGDALGFAKRVIPVEGATLDDRGLHLPWGQDAFEGAPDVADEELDARYGEVEDYYGARSEGGVVRHEEELDVSKRPVKRDG